MSLVAFDALPAHERDLWYAEHAIDQETCPRCGNPIERCSDPDRLWYPQRTICYATRERSAAEELYAALHQDMPYHDGTEQSWSEKRTRSHPYHFTEGTSLWVADHDVNPDDQFLG